jgi:16S rRNA (uracil1498-N3)-methyltransferase
MSRFFAPKENVRDNIIIIDGQEAKHILNVMRLSENDKVVVFDGTGKEYTGFIKETKPKSLIVEIVSVKTPKYGKLPEITLAQALPKKGKMDYIVEKATELGASSVIPILSERTVVKIDEENNSKKTERWKKIVHEAAKQCGRTDVPEVSDIKKFYDVIEKISDFDLALMGCLSNDTINLKEAISNFSSGKIIIFIGPEGDFTPEEIKIAKDANCKTVTFGNRVLKSDTAGLYALSVLAHEFSK